MIILNQFINNMVQAHKDGMALSAIQNLLLKDEIDPEEVSEIIDIIILESRKKDQDYEH